jgi:hypothetical protein
MACQPYERGVFSVKVSFVREKGVRHARRRELDPRGIRESTQVRSPWTNGPAYSGDALASPRQFGRFCLLWIVVDKWIRCEHFP